MNFEQRIANLEKKIKYQRIVLLFLGQALVFSVLLGTSQDNVPGDAVFNEITAKAITIVGEDGKHVMSMGVGADGPGLVIFDAALRPRIAMGINLKDKGAGIAFLDAKSNPRVAMGTNDNGEAGISLLGAGISAPLAGKVWPSE